MRWDGQSYAEDIKYGLNLLLTDEDREKAQKMQHIGFTSYFRAKYKDGMECYSRGVGTGSIVMTYNSNGFNFDFQRPLNNLNETNITLTWSMAARHIRAWEYEKKNIHNLSEEKNTVSFGATAKPSKFNISSFVGEAVKDSRNIIEIPIEKLKPFNNGHQPFRMYTSDKLKELMESIKTSGLLQPVLVWDKGNDEYEILAGHNRVKACKELGMQSVKSIPLKGLTKEQASLVVTDTNLCQRTEMLPSERAAAYQMQKEALKAIGVRNAVEAVSEQYGENRKTISRYLSLGSLNSELMESVDEGKINVNAGAVLSAISEEGQEALADYLRQNPKTKLTEAVAANLKTLLKDKDEQVAEVISKAFEKKENPKPITVKLSSDTKDILDFSEDKLSEFLFFALQHSDWQKEFIDTQNSEDYELDEDLDGLEDLGEDSEEFDEEI